ncbi:Alpha/Beta hydrolase protein [Flagelloscypha sp. PMI_526]|nr:Alpha/Beta hydrolase protein [Flagelloscypha sp. PMI_526]
MTEMTLRLPSGLEFGYYDSGMPSAPVYKTIFALHGYMFNAYTWKKMMFLASSRNVRLVCINRRGYGKTTPLPFDQFPAPDKDNTNILKSTGLDILEFIHAFSLEKSLPLSEEQGGFILLFWSMGNMTGLSAVANIGNASKEVQATMSHLKALILHEPIQVTLGLPPPKGFYTDIFPIIPFDESRSFFQYWFSSYFDHSAQALAEKCISNPNLVYAGPSLFTPPSIYGIDGREEHEKLFQESGGVDMDTAFSLFVDQGEAHENFKKAVFASGVEEKTILVVSDRTVEMCLVTAWHAELAGVKIAQVNGANHFAHWDYPEETLLTYLTVL